ncbi:MAG: acyl carrier protein [bacterium]|jgi:acyl carrier protein
MEDKLKTLLAALLGVDEKVIDNNSSSETIEGWDSLKQMNIVVAVEEEFGIQLNEEESILSGSYESLLKLIKQKLNS